MPVRPPGPYPLPDVTMPTWLVRFDKDGVCTSPATAAALTQNLASTAYSDVLFYSHGWNTDFSDAVGQYNGFLKEFEAVIARRPLPAFKPIFVGVTWPSVWWPADKGPDMAAGDAGAHPDSLRSNVADDLAASLPADQRAEFYELADRPTLDDRGALALATLVARLMGKTPEEVDGTDASIITPEGILKLVKNLAYAQRGPVNQNDDLESFGMVGGGSAGVSAAGESSNPFDFLKLASVFQMKDRAGTVGWNGVAVLLRALLSATPARVHVFGHSFGAKVMLSAICAPAALPRFPDTLLLLQPAISHLCFATAIPGRNGAGGYRSALDRVRLPIISTFSAMDFPLHDVFHLALRRPADLGELKIAAAAAGAGEPPNKYAALGGYGPRGAGEHAPIAPIPGEGEPFPNLGGSRLVGLDGSSNRITSHGDVMTSFTAWALRAQIERSIG